MNTPSKPTIPGRLLPEHYQELERLAKVPYVDSKTSHDEALFILGQQSILRVIRDKFVIGL